MVHRPAKNRTVTVAFEEWDAEIQRLRADKGCDPNAITTTELSVQTGMGLYQAQRYLRSKVQAGTAEKCWKLVNGKRVPAYRKVKK